MHKCQHVLYVVWHSRSGKFTEEHQYSVCYLLHQQLQPFYFKYIVSDAETLACCKWQILSMCLGINDLSGWSLLLLFCYLLVFQDEKAQLLLTYLWMHFVKTKKLHLSILKRLLTSVLLELFFLTERILSVVHVAVLTEVVDQRICQLGPRPVRHKQNFPPQKQILGSWHCHQWIVSETFIVLQSLCFQTTFAGNNKLMLYLNVLQYGWKYSPRGAVPVPVQHWEGARRQTAPSRQLLQPWHLHVSLWHTGLHFDL